MKTPIVDFINNYKKSGVTRLHMPGHKGKSFLGFEAYDITEVKGADALYEADGIIAESEKNATELFGSRRTLYSTEGSSQCIRGMLYLMLVHYRQKMAANHNIIQKRPKIIAARNVHKAFIFAATLLDFDILWLWPESVDFVQDGIEKIEPERKSTETLPEEKNNPATSICSCIITPEQVEEVLQQYPDEIAGVYVTSPDYLGGEMDIENLAKVCHQYGTVLAVDNAHGAYLHFLDDILEKQHEKSIPTENKSCIENNNQYPKDEKSGEKNRHRHPLDAGADICCDSAHKTLPVLTGGAYLHIGKSAPDCFEKQAKYAMALFGSTSPSYLILASLDQCNKYLAEGYREKLRETVGEIEGCKRILQKNGWHVLDSDPLKITIEIPKGMSSEEKAETLRRTIVEKKTEKIEGKTLQKEEQEIEQKIEKCFRGIECEYADPDYLVFMATPENDKKDLEDLVKAMGENQVPYELKDSLPVAKAEQILSIREAMFSDYEEIPVEEALGRICRVPAVSCPPAIPIVVPGERIEREAIELFHYYGMKTLDVVPGEQIER